MQQEIWFQKYQILGLLGKGGSAKVYLAEHIKLKSLRAIKFISKNHPLYELQCKEAILLKNLKHSLIPIIYDIEENEDGSYIIEQYVEGETLNNIISKKGPFREDIIIQFGLQLCDLIQYLHSAQRPILYIDLKPENIILCGDTLKLVDFGSALYLDEVTNQTGYLATEGYAAPELYTNSRIDERCDIYGIGVLLYYMATGRSVIQEKGKVGHIDSCDNCSKCLKKVINQCLKYYPSQRYSSIIKLRNHLSGLKQLEQYQTKSSHTITISIAGSQPRIGVTHLAFRICIYFIAQGQSCLYQEKNDSGCVWSMRNCYEEVDIQDGCYVMEGIPMMANLQCSMPSLESYKVIIRDFGCLTPDNLEEYLSSEMKLLVLGAKNWELDHTEKAVHMTTEYKDVTYLFNYLSGKQFQSMIKSADKNVCHRIPYEPDPFAEITMQSGLEFFQEMFLSNCKPRKGLFKWRRGLVKNEA
jgi:Serine/threonine protein kinase